MSIVDTIQQQLAPTQTTLVAVSKTRPSAQILDRYAEGIRDFGENRVQELAEKATTLPQDIRWHFIGHLQTNKVKYIAPFVHLIHAVDSWKLLKEINKRAAQNERTIDVLLQFKIAEEDTKYGYDANTLFAMLRDNDLGSLSYVRVCGVMGMATYTNDEAQIRREFGQLQTYFQQLKTEFFSDTTHFKEISMGMSGDYQIAVEYGSTMVRIGSLLFQNQSEA